MDAISATTLTSDSGQVNKASSFADLGTEDFLGLLITQLRTQDPLEPMGNQELLDQLASIRDIELSSSLTESLQSLSGQQRFTSASTLIGQFVTGLPGEDGATRSGTVVGIRFADGGEPMLQLSNGEELPVDRVSRIEAPIQAAEALIGQVVVGVDRRDPANAEYVEGVATAVRADEGGEILLELDSGQDLRFRDVIGAMAPQSG